MRVGLLQHDAALRAWFLRFGCAGGEQRLAIGQLCNCDFLLRLPMRLF